MGAMNSQDRSVQDFLHVAVGGLRRLVWRAPMLPRVHVGAIPVPPVVRGMGLLIGVVMLGRFMEQAG
jgi:hypothetical protein